MTESLNVFPTFAQCGDKAVAEGGMTLRDYFAGQAIAGGNALNPVTNAQKNYAEWAYRMADAMLAARESTKEKNLRAYEQSEKEGAP